MVDLREAMVCGRIAKKPEKPAYSCLLFFERVVDCCCVCWKFCCFLEILLEFEIHVYCALYNWISDTIICHILQGFVKQERV